MPKTPDIQGTKIQSTHINVVLDQQHMPLGGLIRWSPPKFEMEFWVDNEHEYMTAVELRRFLTGGKHDLIGG